MAKLTVAGAKSFLKKKGAAIGRKKTPGAAGGWKHDLLVPAGAAGGAIVAGAIDGKVEHAALGEHGITKGTASVVVGGLVIGLAMRRNPTVRKLALGAAGGGASILLYNKTLNAAAN